MQRQIIMNIDSYTTETEFWNDVKDLMKMLSHNNYEILFKYEDCGNYCIEFSTRDRSLGEEIAVWVDAEDYEMMINQKSSNKVENNNSTTNNNDSYF